MGWKKLYIKPNKAAQKAAKRGLEARRKAPKSKRGGLDAIQASVEGVGSGVLRARDIVAGKRVNAYQVNAFFNRHRNNYLNARVDGLKPEESRATQAWLLWGGEPLRKQAAAAVRKDKAKRNPVVYPPGWPPARMSDEDLQDELGDAVARIREAMSEQTLRSGLDAIQTSEAYRERIRRDYDIFQEILRRPHLSLVVLPNNFLLRGKAGGDRDLREALQNWSEDKIRRYKESGDWRPSDYTKIRRQANNILEGKESQYSKQYQESEDVWSVVEFLPYVRSDIFEDLMFQPESFGTEGPIKMHQSIIDNPIARSVAKHNRRARRNPDHIVDLDERRRKADVERMLGSFSPEDLDPVEESTSAIMDSVDDYCRVRGNPRRNNPSIDRSGMISYGEYYGLPDGDGGYDLYYKDRLIASGVQTVREAEEEITRHADLA